MIKLSRIYILIILSSAILVLDYFQSLNFIKLSLDQVIIPIKREIFISTTRLKNIFGVAANYPSLLKFYEEKGKFVKKEEELQERVRQLQEENLKMRMQLEAPFPASYKFVPAQVLSVTRFMEIEGGTGQGIKKGQLVVDGQTLIGMIEDVSGIRSRVRLVTDQDFQIEGVTSRGTRGIVVGQGEQNILLTKVLQKDPLFLDDQVVTTGAEFAPPNLLIGKIVYITQEETATYKQAKIAPVVDFGRERTVFVISAL